MTNPNDLPAANFGDHFCTSEREALIRLCERREEVCGFLWPNGSDCRERSRLGDGLEQLLELIKFKTQAAERDQGRSR